MRPSATVTVAATRSSGVARNSSPFHSTKMIAAEAATRLLPSTGPSVITYDDRSAVSGEMRSTRTIGTAQATTAITASAAGAATKLTRSVAATP